MSRVQKTQNLTGNLSAVEIRNAESLLLKLVQREHFPELINYFNGLNKKKPILVDQLRLCARNNLICTSSRPNKGNISDVNKYLVLLPINSCLTFQIINNFHFEYFHAGVNSVLSQLRERFWLPRGRQIVRGVLRKCAYLALNKLGKLILSHSMLTYLSREYAKRDLFKRVELIIRELCF